MMLNSGDLYQYIVKWIITGPLTFPPKKMNLPSYKDCSPANHVLLENVCIFVDSWWNTVDVSQITFPAWGFTMLYIIILQLMKKNGQFFETIKNHVKTFTVSGWCSTPPPFWGAFAHHSALLWKPPKAIELYMDLSKK